MRENTPMQTLPHSDLAPTGLSWSHRFSNLGEGFTEALEPAPLPQPYWVGHSNSLADRLGLPSGWTESSELLDAFTGNHVLEGSQLRASVRAKPVGLPLRFDPCRITRLQILHSRFGDDGRVNNGFRAGPLQLRIQAIRALP